MFLYLFQDPFVFSIMMSKYWPKARKILFLIGLIYIGVGFLLYFFQDLLLFHPEPKKINDSYHFSQPFQELNLKSGERNLNLVKFRPVGESKGLVIFFHGNMKNVEHYKKYPAYFTSRNYEVWMPDYPGFGKSTGKRTEENIYQDARMVYDSAVKASRKENIIIYGKSIGTGVAAYLASIRPCKQLILETPYYSIEALAKSFAPIYPVAQMTRYSFPIDQYLKNVNGAVTIFHGTKDEVVPYNHSVRLSNENKYVELVRIENGKHNNLSSFPVYQEKMDSLLH